jgi:hypothetical protein
MSLSKRAKDLLLGVPSAEWIRENSWLLGPLRISKYNDEGNCAFFGTVGSGKTTLLEPHVESQIGEGAIPDWVTSINAWVGDPKNDLLPRLSQMGLPLKIISAHVLDQSFGCAWDIWADIDEPISAQQLALDILPDDRRGGEKSYFTDAPRQNVGGVAQEFVNLGRPWDLRLLYLVATTRPYARQLFRQSSDPIVRACLAHDCPEQAETAANVHSSLIANLKNLSTYAALMDACPRKFSIRRLVKGEQILVLGGDFRFGKILAPMNAMIWTYLKRELLSQPDNRYRRNYIFIDEFPRLNNAEAAEEFSDFTEVGRSRGIRVTIVAQSIQQMVRLYGQELTDSILGSCRHKVLFGLGDYASAQYFSRLLGHVHQFMWLRNWSEGGSVSYSAQGRSSSSSSSVGASEQWIDHPLVYPDTLLELPPGHRRNGIHGFCITPALPRTKKFRFLASGVWISEHVRDIDVSLRLDAMEGLVPFPSPVKLYPRLRPLSREEVERFGLTWDPDAQLRP